METDKILLIDDDPAMLTLTRFHLESEGYAVMTADSGVDGIRLLQENNFPLILTDLHLPDVNGIEIVKQAKALSPNTEIIVISGYGSVSGAVEATKAGAFYFVEKPVEYEELTLLIEKALERRQQAEEIKQLRGKLKDRTSYYNIIGSSKAMQAIYEIIDNVAESDANILILGESGTGKELIANAIHYKSARSKKPFVKINCSSLPKELIESELFGHTKGAFTGANMDKIGLIGRASGGSLLLDEIGEMPLELQPKLLRVLQERIYYRLGSEKAQEADFRLISATNRDPLAAVAEGHLREDLYYRINTIEIQVPPLRERAEDIPHLAQYFLSEFAEKYNRPTRTLSQQAYETMFEYAWPGNVRELQNVIERAVLLCKADVIEAAALHLGKALGKAAAASASAVATAVAAPVTLEKEMQSAESAAPPNNGNDHDHSNVDTLFENIGRVIINKVVDSEPDAEREDVFSKLEGALVHAALERTRGNKQAAADLLGVYRARLYGMIKRHHL
ncbi:MAG: sigma-54-dependent Fis family transcriptional regulator [Acidobacteria bacterium]|nr:sigma-54-dependent Fis family transcriptional regulator [Acidobacteriota bacterium]